MPAMLSALERLYSHATVWSCERVGEVVLNAEQVEAMMREENPEWFNANAAPNAAPTNGQQ